MVVNGHKCALHVSLTSVLRATAALSINRAKMRAIGLKYKNCHKIFYVSRESTIWFHFYDTNSDVGKLPLILKKIS